MFWIWLHLLWLEPGQGGSFSWGLPPDTTRSTPSLALLGYHSDIEGCWGSSVPSVFFFFYVCTATCSRAVYLFKTLHFFQVIFRLQKT